MFTLVHNGGSGAAFATDAQPEPHAVVEPGSFA